MSLPDDYRDEYGNEETPQHIKEGISRFLKKLKEKNMQLQGNITNIQPAGGYDSQGGWINTFMMTINTQQGQVTGQIGSKSQQYPMQIGEPITVESTTTQHGVKFKKINPQYQQWGGQQQQNQGQYQGQQQSQGTQRGQQQNNDEKARGMVRHGVICAAIQRGQMKCETWGDVMTYTQFIMTGVIPQEQQNYGGNQAPDQYPDQQSQDPGFDDGSGIPF
uniref:Uncharacterized protein n=1 Tax=viral metagenome TaxID=1070528 RepID=A0A6M3JHU5_9ZZZZ